MFYNPAIQRAQRGNLLLSAPLHPKGVHPAPIEVSVTSYNTVINKKWVFTWQNNYLLINCAAAGFGAVQALTMISLAHPYQCFPLRRL